MITYPKDLYKKLAETTGLPEDDIKDAVFFFWRTGVLEALNNFEKPEIFIRGLGSFHFKEHILKYVIPQIEGWIQQNPEDTNEGFKSYLEYLKKMKLELDQIKQDKTKFNEHSRNIQEQKQDLGGAT